MLTMVTAFRDRETVSRARDHLSREGVALHDAQILDSADGSVESSLVARRVPADDAQAYARAAARGHVLLVASIEEGSLARAEGIMDDYGPVDVEEGLSAAADRMRAVDSGAAATDIGAGAATGRLREDDEEVVPVVEEQLHVGKRTVERGGVRIRTYAVETAVEEAVVLRDESVTIERHRLSPDRPADETAFQERVIEVTETDEVPVVEKGVRVREELVIHKDVQERVETVSDTVRRTEVEVEDGRTDVAADRLSDRAADLPADDASGRVGRTDRTDV
jgi:uncharacterized protein (TIGR02271 family)